MTKKKKRRDHIQAKPAPSALGERELSAAKEMRDLPLLLGGKMEIHSIGIFKSIKTQSEECEQEKGPSNLRI